MMNNALKIDDNYWTPSLSSSNNGERARDVDLKSQFYSSPTLRLSRSSSISESYHPVWALYIGNDKVVLGKPVILRVQYEGDKIFAENDFYEVCGYGETQAEAIQSAIADLEYCHGYYTSLGRDEVAGRGTILKDKYEELI